VNLRKQILQLVVISFSSIIASFLVISNLVFNVIFYFTLVSYFLSSEADVITRLFQVLPMDKKQSKLLAKSLNDSVKGIFFSNIKLAFY